MNIDGLIKHPITTPEFLDPTQARRYIHDDNGFCGYDCVFLDATWHALCHIAIDRGCSVDELCCDIDLNFAPDEDFAPGARRYVLRSVADAFPKTSNCRPGFAF